MAAVVVAIGSRRVVANLERSSNRLRRANQRDRRHARQLAAVESVGRLLAREGPTPAALDSVIGVLEGTFGYRYPSVYVWDGFALQLGAQRNYRFPIQTVDARPGGPRADRAHARRRCSCPDARSDPDFLSGDPDVVSEIGVPLLDEGELLGILNVETSGDHRLDDDDLAIMEIVGDRLAASLALGRERQKLTERAALLDRLTTFATVLVSSLDPETMDDQVAAGASHVIPGDMVALVTVDEPSGEFVIAAVSGGDRMVIGETIKPGEGISGRAIGSRTRRRRRPHGPLSLPEVRRQGSRPGRAHRDVGADDPRRRRRRGRDLAARRPDQGRSPRRSRRSRPSSRARSASRCRTRSSTSRPRTRRSRIR